MNKNIIYAISAIIIFVLSLEFNRQNVNTWVENQTIEYKEKGESEEFIRHIGVEHIRFNLFIMLKIAAPLIALGLIFVLLRNRLKVAFLRVVLVTSIMFSVNFILFDYFDFVNNLNFLFIVLALEFINLKQYLLTFLSLILWLNWYYIINLSSIQYFSETYLTDPILFTSFMDYVPTILGLLLGFSWVKISKYKL